MSKVLLVTCPLELPAGAVPRTYPPLGVAYLAAALLARGYDVRVFDPLVEGIERQVALRPDVWRLGVDEARMAEEVRRFAPDVVGISTQFMGDAFQAHAWAAIVKQCDPAIRVIVGGHYPSLLPARCLADPHVDYVAVGEAEDTLPEMIAYLAGKRAPCPPQFFKSTTQAAIVPHQFPVVRDLNRTPIPARHALNMPRYFDFYERAEPYKSLQAPATTILVTRGCPNQCAFCMNAATTERHYYCRDVSNIRTEIEELIGRYGVKELLFVDENLTHNRRFTEALALLLSEFKTLSWYMLAGTAVYSLTPELLALLRQAGCYRIRFSIESASPATLRQMRKPLDLKKAETLIATAKALGFLTQGQFIMGMPFETLADIHRSYQWAERMDFDYVTFGIVAPYPGTEVYRQAKEAGFLANADDGFDMYCGKGKITTPHFKPEQLEELRRTFWERLNFSSEDKRQRAQRYINPRRGASEAPAAALCTGQTHA